MTQEEKQLLLVDICARLLYGFTIYRPSDNANLKISNIDDFAHFLEYSDEEEFKSYLRPMSSMTEEEKEELRYLTEEFSHTWIKAKTPEERQKITSKYHYDCCQFYYAHHLDCAGLIEKGLALVALEGMYK